MLHCSAFWAGRRRCHILSLTFLKVLLAMMSTQQMQHLLFPNQLQALIQQKQQALMLQQVCYATTDKTIYARFMQVNAEISDRHHRTVFGLI